MGRKIVVFLLLVSMLLMGCGASEGDSSSDGMEVAVEELGDGAEVSESDNETDQPELNQGDESMGENVSQNALQNELRPLSVVNGKLVDDTGNAVQLRGMSSHGLGWYPEYINEDAFLTLRDDWKTNCVRLALYTAEDGGYCVSGRKEELKTVVKNGVEYATTLGMYVIIDWHILSDNNPKQYQEEAVAFFEEMSSLYQDYPNVIYEICNEPNGSTTWSDVKDYANVVIPVIRKNASEAVVLVGSPCWSQEIDKALQDPLSFENVMYTLHFYADTHRDDLRNRLKTCADAGLPIFVSEFGMCDASGNGANNFEESEKWLNLLDEYQISYMCWNLANRDESSSVFKASSTRLFAWTEEDLNPSGVWIRNWFREKSDN